MTFPVRFHWTLGVAASLALVATACNGDLTEPAPTTDAAGEVLPEAPSAVVPDGHVVLGEFEVSVNPYIGHVDLRWLEPTDYFSEYMAAAQASLQTAADENEFFAEVWQSQKDFAEIAVPFWAGAQTSNANLGKAFADTLK